MLKINRRTYASCVALVVLLIVSKNAASALDDKMLKQGYEFYEQGTDAANKGDFQKAINLFQKSLNLMPDNPDTLFNLGYSYYSLGRFEEAIQTLGRCIVLQGSRADAYSYLALSLLQHRDPAKALAAAEQAINLNTDLQVGQYAAGIVYLHLSFKDEVYLEKAILHLERATKLDPNHASSYIDLGVAYARQGRVEDAVIALQNSLELDPNSPDAYLNLGRIYEDVDWPEAAEICFQQAKALAPNSPIIKAFFENKPSLSAKKGSKSEKANTLVERGIQLYTLGNLAGALQLFQEASATNRASPISRVNMGNMYLEMGEIEKAEEAYTLAVKLAPQHPGARYSLGNYYLKKERWEEAIKEFERAKTSGMNDINLNRSLGKAYLLNSQFDKAEITFEYLLKLLPEDANAWYMLGVTYIQLNDGWKAREAFKKCVEYDPSFAEAHYELGWLYSGYDPNYARKELEIVLQLNPSHERARKELEELNNKNR